MSTVRFYNILEIINTSYIVACLFQQGAHFYDESNDNELKHQQAQVLLRDRTIHCVM